MLVNGKGNLTPAGDKANVEEPMVYATKQVFSYPNFLLLISVALSKTLIATIHLILHCWVFFSRRPKLLSSLFWNLLMFNPTGHGNR